MGLALGLLLTLGVVGGCASDDGGSERSASATADTVTVECYFEMRSGDEPVVWERELPVGDEAAYSKAAEDCAKDQSGGKLRTVN
jgi:ABC-type glycerol-3-phosphate transport system substrate-binding protein